MSEEWQKQPVDCEIVKTNDNISTYNIMMWKVV